MSVYGVGMSERDAAAGMDTTRMHPARRYDYYLGGEDNFEADRANAEMLARVFPAAKVTARENRRFLRRAVHMLAAEGGVRQFLDIGTGLPTQPNVHEIAQAVDPGSRVVYVDNAQFARFFRGLELLPPGIVPVSQWRADDEPEPRPAPAEAAVYAAVARKH